MAKPSKPSSEDFLAKRRQAIADRANKRMKQQQVRGGGVSTTDQSAKTAGAITLTSPAPSTQS